MLTTLRKRGTCGTCGASAKDGIFCRMCGSRLHERVAVDGRLAGEAPGRLFRSTTSLPAAVALATLVVLFAVLAASGAWVAGVAVLAVVAGAAVAIPLFRRASEAPRSPLADVRYRALFTLAVVHAWWAARREIAAIDRELRRLHTAREQRVLVLGEAAYRDDEEPVAQAREAIRSVDEEIAQQHESRRRVVETASSHIERERRLVVPTEIVEGPGTDGRPPAPNNETV